MKKKPNLKWTSIGLSIIFIVLGIFLAIFPTTSIHLICTILGILALIAGAFRMFHYFKDRTLPHLLESELALGIIEFVGGLVLIINPTGVITLLPVVIGGYIVVESVFSIQTAIDALSARYKYSGWLLVLAIAPLVLGLVLIFFSGNITSFIVRLLGIALIIWGICQLWMTASAAKMIDSFRLDMYDNQEGKVE